MEGEKYGNYPLSKQIAFPNSVSSIKLFVFNYNRKYDRHCEGGTTKAICKSEADLIY